MRKPGDLVVIKNHQIYRQIALLRGGGSKGLDPTLGHHLLKTTPSLVARQGGQRFVLAHFNGGPWFKISLVETLPASILFLKWPNLSCNISAKWGMN